MPCYTPSPAVCKQVPSAYGQPSFSTAQPADGVPLAFEHQPAAAHRPHSSSADMNGTITPTVAPQPVGMSLPPLYRMSPLPPSESAAATGAVQVDDLPPPSPLTTHKSSGFHKGPRTVGGVIALPFRALAFGASLPFRGIGMARRAAGPVLGAESEGRSLRRESRSLNCELYRNPGFGRSVNEEQRY